MMKRVFTLYALVAILVVATYASDRTESQMRAIASQQLFKATSRGTAPTAKNLTLELKDSHLSLYSAEGRGFVVVSRDNTFPAVLGTSATAIDMKNLPDGFRWWLTEANKSMQRRLETNEWYTTRSPMAVEPFLTTKWDQGTPFNLKCPKTGTSYYPTGCVATAAAQIMKYYNYPEQGEGVAKYTKDKLPRTKTIEGVYDWANMKDRYANNMTDMTPEVEAVSTLMADVGAACNMTYTINYGGASLTDCASGLIHHLKYDSLSLRAMYRVFFSDAEWEDMIYNELLNKRPILYCGMPDDGSSGHAFVFHGLDADGKVYVNWGWSGICDGYFDFNVLLPGKEAKQHGNFSFNSQMIYNFNPTQTPAEGTEEQTVWITDTLSYFSIEKDSLVLTACGIYNYNYRYFRGKLIVALENTNGVDDDSFHYILYDTEDEKDGGAIEMYYGFVFNNEDRNQYGQETICSLKDDEIKPGTYIVTLASQGLYESHISPMRYYGGVKCQAKLVKGADGKIELTDYTASGITPVTYHPATSPRIYDLQGHNLGTNPSALRKGIYIKDGKKVAK
ncbi:MAG: C10 family peptidase [Prevotella sp.]|nr:C10 family peptidase [Prevotella sp.]